MISIRRSEVPLYLQSSSFYLSLSEDDDEHISVDSTNFKLDTYVGCANDLRHLLCTIRFWGLDSVPSEVIAYCMGSENSDEVLSILGEFDSELDYLRLFPELLKLPQGKRVQRCAQFGNLPILQYIVEKEGGSFSTAISVVAATGGSLPCLKYLVEQNCPVDITAAIAASRHNRLDCLVYLCDSIGILLNYSVTQAAVSSGHLPILQYIHQRGGPWGQLEFTQTAARRGHLQCLKYLTENGCPWGRSVCSFAAENGHLNCLQYAREHGCEWIESDMNEYRSVTTNAASNGHLECLMYAHQAGCPIGTSACHAAAWGGHLLCLKYAHEKGGVWSDATTYAASRGGHLDCLQYAIEHGCPVAENITESAASASTLDCLQYLVTKGYKLTPATSASAAQFSVKHLASVHSLGCPWDEHTCTKAAGCTVRDASVLQYAHENGCPWDARTCAAAARTGNLKALKYAHEHGCPWDEATTSNAVQSDEIICFEYAHAHGCPTPADIDVQADLHNSKHCMLYIQENITSSIFDY